MTSTVSQCHVLQRWAWATDQWCERRVGGGVPKGLINLEGRRAREREIRCWMVVNRPDIDHRHRGANAECRSIRDAGSAEATVSRVGVSCAADRDAEESRMQEELAKLEPVGAAGRCAEDQLKSKNGEISGADRERRVQTLWRIGGGL
mmetsp:Transcript_157000/g.500756  ORF Transcript_157000/g.500756 Transcript_157000/m.500756 type:complete len:148 (+) Transcript_157000:422-865(+)